MRKFLLLVFIVPGLLFLTSCWDYIEIERSAFILGIGLDKEGDQILVTYQIAQPNAYGREGGGDVEGFVNINITAEDISEANIKLLNQIDLSPSFEHCQVLLIGEDLARSGLKKNLDFFIRDAKVRKRMLAAVVQGKAKEVLDVKVKTAKSPSLYISTILNESSRTSFAITSFVDVGHIFDNLVRNSDLVLPKIIPLKERIVVEGGAAFIALSEGGMRMVDWLSVAEIEGIKFLSESAISGRLLAKLPEEMGGNIDLLVFNVSTSLVPEFRDGALIAKSKVHLEGDINRMERLLHLPKNPEEISALEKALEKYISRRIDEVFTKVRDELGVEVFEFDRKVSSYYPKYWEKNKDNWHEIFKTVKLETDVDVKIRRVGEVTR